MAGAKGRLNRISWGLAVQSERHFLPVRGEIEAHAIGAETKPEPWAAVAQSSGESPLAIDDVVPRLRERLPLPLVVVDDLLRIHLPKRPGGRRAGATPYRSKRNMYEPRLTKSR
jgi:hypothetical protein